MRAAAILAAALLAGCPKREAPEDAQADPVSDGPVRFDGVYRSIDGRAHRGWTYIRFFPDHHVLEVFSTRRLTAMEELMTPTYEDGIHSSYSREGDRIEWANPSSDSGSRSVGVFDEEGTLTVDWRTDSTQSQSQYRFFPWPGPPFEPEPVAVRTDGLYRTHEQDTSGNWHHVRFLGDGRVTLISGDDAPEDVFRTLDPDADDFQWSLGEYPRGDAPLVFSTRSTSGLVEFWGRMSGGDLELYWWSHIVDRSGVYTYAFIPVPGGG